jgi:hypothetical protein
MSWTWQYFDNDGVMIDAPVEPCVTSAFPNQIDAEAFVSDTWPQLRTAGISAVTLLDGDRVVYGPMSLDPA